MLKLHVGVYWKRETASRSWTEVLRPGRGIAYFGVQGSVNVRGKRYGMYTWHLVSFGLWPWRTAVTKIV